MPIDFANNPFFTDGNKNSRRKHERGAVIGRLLLLMLLLPILGAIVGLGYTIAFPETEKFTEFYILAADGRATHYPDVLAVGEEGRVLVGVVNHEGKTKTYRIAIAAEGRRGEFEPVILRNGEKWERQAGFVFTTSGKDQTVEFLLYIGEDEEPYMEPLRLLVDITE